jgi:transposase
MRAYSQDLRERALAAWATGDETQAEVAERFGISKSTLEKWSYQQRDTGSCAAQPHVSGPARTLARCEAVIRASVKQQPDLTLAELCERVQAAQGVSASPSMMCRELQHLELVRKKSRSTIASVTRHA